MKKILLCVATLATVALAGCGVQGPQTVKTVKIGVIAPLSGPAGNYGIDAVNTYKDRLEQFKQDNPTIKIDVITEDGKCSGKDGSAAAQKLINVDKVDVILGGRCSSETIPAGTLAQENGVTLFSAGGSAPSISTLGDHVFRLRNDAVSAVKLNEYMAQHYKNVAIVYENTDFGKGIADKFKALYTGNISLDIPFSTNEKDFNIIANNIKENQQKIDGILLMNGADAGAIGFIRALKNIGLLEKYQKNIVGVYQLTSHAFLEGVGTGSAEGLTQVNIDLIKLGGDKGKAYINYFKNKYGILGVDQYILVDVEGIDVILSAIKNGAKTSDDFKKYFESINSSNKRTGTLGTYYFDQNGDAEGLESALIMETIHNGKGVPLN